MTDKLREEAERLARQLRNQCSVVPTRPLDALDEIFQIQIHSALQKARNDALEEVKKLIASAMEDSGDGMPVVERLTYYAKPFLRNEARRELANKLEKLKVKP